jgi:exodeoxyribonuclease V gamma subunit
VCIGRAKRGTAAMTRLLGPPGEPAVDVLRGLVRLYDAGRREPLPLPVRTSYAWAEARLRGADPEQAAGYRWYSNTFPGEDQDVAYAKVWGKRAPLRTLLTAPGPGEEVAGEHTRLGAFAARLWLPLLRAELEAH